MKKKLTKKLLKKMLKIYLVSVLALATLVLMFIELASTGTISGLSLAPSFVALIVFGLEAFVRDFKEVIYNIKNAEDEE